MPVRNPGRHTPDELERIGKLRAELEEALADEADAASRAASALQELEDLDVDTTDLRPS